MKPFSLPGLVLILVCTGCVATSTRRDFHGYVSANGIHTYYERHGDGPPLVLLHGAAMVAEGWRPQVEDFSRHFTVYVPERRGVGRTSDVEGGWSYRDMAADTAAFMDALNIRKASVVGFSDGGNIALILAFTRPDLVDKLVVSGANLNPEGLGGLKDELKRMSTEEFLASAPPQVQPWLEVHRRVSPDGGRDLLKSFTKMKRMWLDFEIKVSNLGLISAPTLVMCGDHDMIPVSHTVEIWTAVHGAQLCVAPNASHFWLQEKPRLANEFILGFLLESPPTPAH